MVNYIETAQKIAGDLSNFAEVCGVISENVLFEFDHTHPYMSVTLDVYYGQGGVPEKKERKKILEKYRVEVSTETRNRTYGLRKGIPFQLRCIDKRVIDYLIKHLDTQNWQVYEKTTKIFYNILHGHILIERENWLSEAKEFLAYAPEMMWINLKSSAVSRMTLDLALLEDALAHCDRMLAIQAEGRFLEALMQVLFLSNKQFAPPLRLQQLELEKLQLLPPEFAGRLGQLLDFQVDATHRLEIALQLAMEATLL